MKVRETAEERKFAVLFKNITARYGVRNVAMAKKLGVTSQYISKLFRGTTLPSREQMDSILELLGPAGVSSEEMRSLISCFIEDKTGYFYELPDLQFSARTQLERKLLSDFRMLSSANKKSMLAEINRLLIDSLKV